MIYPAVTGFHSAVIQSAEQKIQHKDDCKPTSMSKVCQGIFMYCLGNPAATDVCLSMQRRVGMLSLTRWIWIFSLSPWGKANHLNTFQVCFLHLHFCSDKSALAPEDDSPLFAATAPSSQAGHSPHPNATAPSSQAGRPPLPDENAPSSQAGRPPLPDATAPLSQAGHPPLPDATAPSSQAGRPPIPDATAPLSQTGHPPLLDAIVSGWSLLCMFSHLILYACVVAFL